MMLSYNDQHHHHRSKIGLRYTDSIALLSMMSQFLTCIYYS